MLIREAGKETLKVKAMALLNKLMLRSAGILSFFPDRKNLDHDKKSNNQCDRSICTDIKDLPVLETNKVTCSFIVLQVISDENTSYPRSPWKSAFGSQPRSTKRLWGDLWSHRRAELLTDTPSSSVRTPAWHEEAGRPTPSCSTMLCITVRQSCGHFPHPTAIPSTVEQGLDRVQDQKARPEHGNLSENCNRAGSLGRREKHVCQNVRLIPLLPWNSRQLCHSLQKM